MRSRSCSNDNPLTTPDEEAQKAMELTPEEVSGLVSECKLGTKTGGRAGINPIEWNLPDDVVNDLRSELLQQADINKVKNALQEFGIPVDNQMIEAVKRYIFDSPGIAFTRKNPTVADLIVAVKRQKLR